MAYKMKHSPINFNEGDKDKDKKNKSPKKVTINTKTGSTVEINKSTSTQAKKKQGKYFKEDSYKGTTVKNKSGKTSSVRLNSGKVIKATNSVSRKNAEKALAYDKKVFTAQQKKKSARTKRMATNMKVTGRGDMVADN